MEKISLFGITLLGLEKSEKSSITNSELRSSIISQANSFPLNNLTIGIYLELLSPPFCFVTILALKTYPEKLIVLYKHK